MSNNHLNLAPEFWFGFQIPLAIPEDGLDWDQKNKRDKEDAKHLLALRKKIAKKQLLVPGLQAKVAAEAHCGTGTKLYNLLELTGDEKLGELQFASAHPVTGELKPVRVSSQAAAGKAAVALSNLYEEIAGLNAQIEQLRASQEAE